MKKVIKCPFGILWFNENFSVAAYIYSALGYRPKVHDVTVYSDIHIIPTLSDAKE